MLSFLRRSRSAGVARAAAEIQALEDRRMLALTLGVDGAGRLHSVTAADAAQEADVTLTVQPGNRVTVAEGTNVYGTFKAAPNLAVSLGDNESGFVNRLDLNNQTLESNVRVELGDTGGLNQFRLTTAAGGTGTLDGNYTVRGGDTGSEFLVFGDFGQTAPKTINVTGSVKVDAGGGGQDPNAGPPDAVATVGTGPNTSFLNVGRNMDVKGSTVLALAGSIGGDLHGDSSDKGVGQLVILGNFGRTLEVGGNVRVATGDANDEVDVQGVLVGGNLDVRTNGGNDTILVTDDADATKPVPTNAPTRVGGNVRIDAGDGNDSMSVDALRAPRAHAAVQLGDGNDSFRFGDNANVDLASLLIDGGPGTDTYSPGAGNVFNFKIRVVDVP
jgi:hypothetical protein